MDIQEALDRQSVEAIRRHKEIKKYMFLTLGYMLMISAIFIYCLFIMANANHDLSETIERRSPVLECLRCHDDLEDKKSQAQTELLLSFINDRDNPSEATQINFDEAVLNYDIASKKLLNPDSCPDFPN
jgi:hypothetical protein